MKENEILREIMRDAKIGWWQADRNRRVFHISEGLRDLLGVCSCEVTYEEFGKMITPAYREYALASIGVRGGAERLYPLQGAEGEIWCYWKLLREEVADDGGMLLTGYFRVVDPPSEVVNSQEKQRINDLLFRLNSISQTLLSLLKVDDLDAVVNKILADVLTMFDGGRAYIIESDPEHRLYNCTYEVTAENVTGEQELVSGISMDEVPWWTQRIANGQPVIISSLDELPDEAFREREVLAMQDIKSLIAVPRIGQKLVVKDADGKVIEREKDWRDQPIAVEAKGLTITYPGHLMQPDFKAVDGIDFTIHRSEVLGLVGESGSGKSTTGRAIAGLQKVSGGSLNVLGIEMNGVKERDFKPKRADIGFVFQDPGSSFNPLMTIAENVAEPLIVHKKFSSVSDARKYVGDLLEMVQLPRAYMNRFPHELSGGQRQRASLARALALKPSLLIADEPTSALDVSVQAKVLELFKKLQAEIGFACLFITHDLAVVDMLADRIMVMHKGQIVEHGDADQIMQNPQNPYTQKLLASLPVPDPREQRKHREHLHELLAAQQ